MHLILGYSFLFCFVGGSIPSLLSTEEGRVKENETEHTIDQGGFGNVFDIKEKQKKDIRTKWVSVTCLTLKKRETKQSEYN